MKKILILTMILASLGSGFSAFAEDETLHTGQVGATGADPNEEKKADGADVAAQGICKECIARLKAIRLGQPSNPGQTSYSPSESGTVKVQGATH